MRTRTVLDVRELPTTTVDHRSIGWWGNAGMLVIEGTMFALCAATYLYLRMKQPIWPPPPIPAPDWIPGTCVVVALVVGTIAMRRADLAARDDDRARLRRGIAISVACGVAAILFRAWEFAHLRCWWTDGAYGAVTWLIPFMHCLHLLGTTGENAWLLVVIAVHGADRQRRLDARINAAYYYFVAAWGLALHLLVQIGSRS
jgi:cytochrome c oxidase subunit 3